MVISPLGFRIWTALIASMAKGGSSSRAWAATLPPRYELATNTSFSTLPAAVVPTVSVPGTALTGRGEGLGRGVPPVEAEAGTNPLAPLGDSASRDGTGAEALTVGRYPVTPGFWSSACSPPVPGCEAGAAGSAYSGAKKVGVRGCGTDVSRETSLCTVTSLPL